MHGAQNTPKRVVYLNANNTDHISLQRAWHEQEKKPLREKN